MAETKKGCCCGIDAFVETYQLNTRGRPIA